MTKKIPMRRCVVSNQMFPKKDLLRITKNKQGLIAVDPTGKAHGRGAYLLKDLDIIDKAQKTKVLERVLQSPISNDVYDEIRQLLK